ncbi:MAG: hypothetical protein A3F92_00570 [Candidatus Rokubacteria bacterium RIFCSPLOWO2_12_FULL_71_22]|nr:MAG: hypothetical protein A3F92_00570 [Candidatus Rokubacteria bacterium RIFCSPLOWO2_12_FULL_71_22]
MIGRRVGEARRLFAAWRRGTPLAAGAVVASAVATAFEGFGVVMLLPFLQRVLQGGPEPLMLPLRARALEQWLNGLSASAQLVTLGVLIVGSVAGREALLYAVGYLKLLVSMRTADVVRARLHAAFVEAPLALTSRYPHGHFQNYLHTEANRVRQLVTQLMSLAQTAIVAATLIAVMALISLRLVVLVLVVLAALGLPLVRLFRWVHATGSRRVQSRIEIVNYLAELMPFLRSVHIFGSQRQEIARFAARYTDVTQRDLRLYAVNNLVTPVYHTAGALVVLGLVLLGVWLAAGSPGGAAWVIPFVLLFVRFLPILNELNLALSYLADGFASYEKLEAELATLRGRRMEEGGRRFPAVFGALELHGVSFAYEPDAPVLRDVSLTIPRGRHVAVVGPSGCGKSTLCLLLCRLYDPTNGSVRVDGADLRTFSLGSLREAITLVEQTPVLLNDTVRANIAYGRSDASDAEIRFAAKRAHADDFIAEFPHAYETNVGNLGTAISGGQRQRIAIARALLRSPQVLIFDEATSAVDSVSEALIKQTIEELRGVVTVVSVAHRLSTIRDADEIHFVSGGRIACSGTFAELVVKHAEFREYVRAQDLSSAP